MKPALFRPAAAADIEDAFAWYERQRVGLGHEYLSAVQAALELLVANPRLYPVVHRDTRRALIHRFPYSVFYRLHDEQVIVVACFHAKRSPRVWKARK